MMKKLILFCFLFSIFSSAAFAQNGENGRPDDFPIPPKNENYLFFIQRNRNKNTIIYDAKVNDDGSLNSSDPVDVYWRRYNGSAKGHRDELKWIEQKFAYGYSSKSDKSGGHYVELVAYDERKIHLKKDENGKPTATIKINGKDCFLDYLWVFADESGAWPTVIHVDIHGREVASGKKQVERIVND